MTGAEAASAVDTAAAGVTPTRAEQGAIRLSRPQAERVIHRALHLQDTRRSGPDDTMTLAQVEEVAAQVGVAPHLVRQALTEVRLATVTEYQPSRTERLLGPRRVAGAAVVDADPQQVRAASRQWMVHDEGMKRTGSRDDVDRWVKDKRLLVEIRRGLQATRGNGVLRDLTVVHVDVQPDEAGSIVCVDADTTAVQRAASGTAVAGVLGGIGVGLAAAAAIPDTAVISADIAQFAVGFAGSVAVGLGSAVVVARSWIGRVREGVDQALDGIAMTTRDPELPSPPSTATGWRRTALRWLGGDR